MSTRTRQTLTDELVKLMIDQYGAPADINAETSYESLDLDSLVMVEVAVALSSRYDVFVTEDEMRAAATIADTVAMLEAKGVRA
jgi:acyl carrier protein